MIRTSFFALILSLVFNSLAAAAETPLIYQDQAGVTHRRWVLTEKHENGSELLLVIEANPDSNTKGLAQDTLFRKLYAADQMLAFNADLESYRNFSDLKNQHPTSKSLLFTPGRPLWTATAAWNESTEADYGNWVAQTVNTDFLQNSGLIVDCADFAVTLRWVYARDHQLPVANTLAATGQLVGQFSSSAAWDVLPTASDWRRDERFKAALRYVLNGTYTHSIQFDLYPVELNRTYVTPGSIDLVLYSDTSGHTEVIKSVGSVPGYCDAPAECIMVYFGNEPAASTIYYDSALFMNVLKGGFSRWRWAEYNGASWVLRPGQSMPGYSTMQWSQPGLDDGSWERWVFEQIGLSATPLSETLLYGRAFMNLISQRTSIVANGAIYCYYSPCATTSPDYDNYSTPSRDARIIATRAGFMRQYSAVQNEPAMQQFMNGISANYIFYWGGPTYADYLFDSSLSSLVSDPSQSLIARWSLGGASIESQYAMMISSVYRDANLLVKQIQQGYASCVQHTCSASTAASLSTATLNQGLLQLRNDAFALHTAPMGMDNQIAADFEQRPLGVGGCTWNSGGQCTLYDLVFYQTSWMQQMSADPRDSLERRFGMSAK